MPQWKAEITGEKNIVAKTKKKSKRKTELITENLPHTLFDYKKHFPFSSIILSLQVVDSRCKFNSSCRASASFDKFKVSIDTFCKALP